MTKQSELQLENSLIKQLVGLGYQNVTIPDGDALVSNLKAQLEVFNNTTFSTREFDTILNHLEKGNVFEKAKTLRNRFNVIRDNGDSFYIRFYNSEAWTENTIKILNDKTSTNYKTLLNSCCDQIISFVEDYEKKLPKELFTGVIY